MKKNTYNVIFDAGDIDDFIKRTATIYASSVKSAIAKITDLYNKGVDYFKIINVSPFK